MRRIKKLVINIISAMFSSAYFTIIFFTLVIITLAYAFEKIVAYFDKKKEKRKSWKKREEKEK